MEAWPDMLSLALTLYLIVAAAVEDRRAAAACVLGVVLIVLRVGVAQRRSKVTPSPPPVSSDAVRQQFPYSEKLDRDELWNLLNKTSNHNNPEAEDAQTDKSQSPSSTTTASPVEQKKRRAPPRPPLPR